jgi:iron complex transport system ATP-binding protein
MLPVIGALKFNRPLPQGVPTKAQGADQVIIAMLEAQNITVRYGRRTVLDDVSLTLSAGKIVVLLGANGAGKTTLIRALNNTLAQPHSGEVLLQGTDMRTLSRREIARSIAVVAQENETRFPVTVLEFVLSGRFVHGGAFGWETASDFEYAAAALAQCDLADYESRLMNNLSGGERQRVVLARALAAGTKILLLDEPTANLDLAHQAMMFRLVRQRCKQSNYAAVVITHDLNLASEFGDEIVMLKDGRVAANGTPDQVLTAENIANVFGVKALLDKNPVSGKVRVTGVY